MIRPAFTAVFTTPGETSWGASCTAVAVMRSARVPSRRSAAPGRAPKPDVTLVPWGGWVGVQRLAGWGTGHPACGWRQQHINHHQMGRNGSRTHPDREIDTLLPDSDPHCSLDLALTPSSQSSSPSKITRSSSGSSLSLQALRSTGARLEGAAGTKAARDRKAQTNWEMSCRQGKLQCIPIESQAQHALGRRYTHVSI